MCSVIVFAEHRRPLSENNVLPPRARGVCRRLFADESSASRREEFLQDLQRKMGQESREQWNFDFEKGIPLKGRFQWTPVTDNSTCLRKPKSTTPKSNLRKPKSNKSQSKITDFLTSRKRSTSSSSSSSPKTKVLRVSDSPSHRPVST